MENERTRAPFHDKTTKEERRKALSEAMKKKWAERKAKKAGAATDKELEDKLEETMERERSLGRRPTTGNDPNTSHDQRKNGFAALDETNPIIQELAEEWERLQAHKDRLDEKQRYLEALVTRCRARVAQKGVGDGGVVDLTERSRDE